LAFNRNFDALLKLQQAAQQAKADFAKEATSRY
jgi:hypothetical protein